jgi:hypothetical protein
MRPKSLTTSKGGIGSAAAFVLLALPCGSNPTIAADPKSKVQACAQIAAERERLACYDREVRNLVEPTFLGRLSKTTDRFRIDAPTLLRYQSDGPIFVLYLKASDDTVVQNLHIGGGGEDSYLIDRPGTYYLDVSGSETWRIWLEPQKDMKTN